MRRPVLWISLALAATAAFAAGQPRTLASVWLEKCGEGRMPDGKVYRLIDEKGHPYRLKERVVLEILDTNP